MATVLLRLSATVLFFLLCLVLHFAVDFSLCLDLGLCLLGCPSLELFLVQPRERLAKWIVVVVVCVFLFDRVRPNVALGASSSAVLLAIVKRTSGEFVNVPVSRIQEQMAEVDIIPHDRVPQMRA